MPLVEALPIGQKIDLPGHFLGPVTLEGARPLGAGFELRVRCVDGKLQETVITAVEAAALCGAATPAAPRPAEADKLRLLVESARIRLAYAHDPQFAVSLSGIRTLPHQIEAVYAKMLPQPRLRFLLADDPGAGKTIMAGLLVKEMKLRQAIERILVLCPAPLTLQWQEELLRWFGESFELVFSAVDQQQLVNPWRRPQLIASLDYAKQEGVRERVWNEPWDLVIIDEAHKCSAYTKSGGANRGDEVEKTKRYQLAEQLAARCDNLLLLTATPHHGDDDRFGHFVRLLDRDLFLEPRLGARATEIRREVLRLGEDCPWALRRLKEDLKDFQGRRLFPDRHAATVPFRLNAAEYALYRAVTAYINEYLALTPGASGSKRHSVALARTVLQRRLASSTHAIYESLNRRLKKQQELLESLEGLSAGQLAKRLAQLQGRASDAEQDEDDLDEAERDVLTGEFTAAAGLDQIRTEIAALGELVAQARRVRDGANDSKLEALAQCLRKAEFGELRDGRGKLLVFTEHRDTLNHLRENLAGWGYSVCEIHGGMNPHERRRAQEQFRTAAQICLATEAAGEGINLQFCRLMINYDLPWNPTRLEQRLGRIHRIGQERDVYAFNFVAAESEDGQDVIEGRILERLLAKLEQMRAVLADRVFDVIGEVLALNAVNLPEMLRAAAHDPHRLGECLEQIERVDPSKLREYEQLTGIALARANVDFAGVEQRKAEAEERRLMPRYVERFFLDAAAETGLRLERRADGLWRAEHVPQDLRSDGLASVARAGRPESSYRKLTFHKEDLERDQHLDAVLLGPGHPLYAAVDERLQARLGELAGASGVFLDERADTPYALHFFEVAVLGYTAGGAEQTIWGELVAVRTEDSGLAEVVPADLLLDLPAHPSPPEHVPALGAGPASDLVKSAYLVEKRTDCQRERGHFADICRDYLAKSFDARRRAAQDRVMELRAREANSPEMALARQRAEADLEAMERSHAGRLAGLEQLTLARQGPVRHLASALVLPATPSEEQQLGGALEELDPETRRRIEVAAEDAVIAFEQARGFECERVGHLKIGFDIRSIGPADAQTGYRDPVAGIRRIEVKGRRRGQPVRLTTNEWYKAAQLGDSYWLYVVWDPLADPGARPQRIQNPARVLDHAKREVAAARYYDISAADIEKCAEPEP